MKTLLFPTLLVLSLCFGAAAQESDTLRSQRKALSTVVYRGDQRLESGTVLKLMKEEEALKARRQFMAGKIMQPLGPLIAVGGVALGYDALKGTPASRVLEINGVDYTANYVIRSRPKLAGGIGLLAAGVVLLEFANELIGKSVSRFNSDRSANLSSSGNHRSLTFNLGATPSGMGVSARF